MAADEAMAQGVVEGTVPPTVRVFGWRPPAVSFGYAQRVAREVDVGRCRRMGVDIVRRPSGGRAVLHWHELTYSVVCPEDDLTFGGSIQDAYRKISLCLVAGLSALGVNAGFEPGRQPAPSPRGPELTAPCFSSTTQYEVTLGGRKLAGSAQRRMNGVLLQHGSLLIGPQHKRIVELLPEGRDPVRARFAAQLEAHTISLEEAQGRRFTFEEVAAAIRTGFASSLGCGFADGAPSERERESSDILESEKYATDAWNFGPPLSDEGARPCT
jgi:lipoate-protein ligase A